MDTKFTLLPFKNVKAMEITTSMDDYTEVHMVLMMKNRTMVDVELCDRTVVGQMGCAVVRVNTIHLPRKYRKLARAKAISWNNPLEFHKKDYLSKVALLQMNLATGKIELPAENSLIEYGAIGQNGNDLSISTVTVKNNHFVFKPAESMSKEEKRMRNKTFKNRFNTQKVLKPIHKKEKHFTDTTDDIPF